MVRIIHRDDLPLGGFAGIVETQMVLSPQVWRDAAHRDGISHGLDDFIYLSTGHFKPNDGAPMHPHRDVDIVSVILSGEVGHKGTLGDGTVIKGPGVQVQRAGSGMQHSEFSLNDSPADFVQIWIRPPEAGLTPDYQSYPLDESGLTTVIGGSDGDSFHSKMVCRVGFLGSGESVRSDRSFVAMIFQGTATVQGQPVGAGDLMEGDELDLTADEKIGLILLQGARERSN